MVRLCGHRSGSQLRVARGVARRGIDDDHSRRGDHRLSPEPESDEDDAEDKEDRTNSTAKGEAEVRHVHTRGVRVLFDLLSAILFSLGNTLDGEKDDAGRDELDAEASEVAGDEVLRREARVADDAADAGAAPGEEASDREVARRVDGGLDHDNLLLGRVHEDRRWGHDADDGVGLLLLLLLLWHYVLWGGLLLLLLCGNDGVRCAPRDDVPDGNTLIVHFFK